MTYVLVNGSPIQSLHRALGRAGLFVFDEAVVETFEVALELTLTLADHGHAKKHSHGDNSRMSGKTKEREEEREQREEETINKI